MVVAAPRRTDVEAADERGQAQVGQVELEQVTEVLGSHQDLGVDFAGVAGGAVDERAAGAEGGRGPCLVVPRRLAALRVKSGDKGRKPWMTPTCQGRFEVGSCQMVLRG
jgi:hypothetical protein